MNKENNNSNGIVFIAILTLSLFLSALGAYAFYKGYYDFLEKEKLVTLCFAVVLFIWLMLTNYSFWVCIRNEESKFKVILSYIVIAIFTFAANFNFVYSRAIGNELLEKELEEKSMAIEEIRNRAGSELKNKTAENLKNAVDIKVEQLVMQIENPQEPGIGTKAKGIISEIESLLEQKLTVLVQKTFKPGAILTTDELNELKVTAEKYKEMIYVVLNKKIASMNDGEIYKYANEINDKSNNTIENLRNALGKLRVEESTESIDNAKKTLQEAVETYRSTGLRLKDLLKDKSFKFNENMSVNNIEIGKISHSYESAKNNLTNFKTWGAVLLALLIDFLTPFLIWAHNPSVEKRKTGLIPIDKYRTVK